MLSPQLRDRLTDPGYRDMHLKAVGVLRGISGPRWYDGHFHMVFEAAKRFITIARPDRLEAFDRGFDILRTPKDFAVREVDDAFSPETHAEIQRVVASIVRDQLESHEIADFGRQVVHNFPYFTKLQKSLTSRLSELVGCHLEPGYNFLSLYGSSGRCALHMDHPLAMYTLDYCIDQNVEWPINFSSVVNWPDLDMIEGWSPEKTLTDHTMNFRNYTLEPGSAILFSGSGQWHYRDPIPTGGYCNLLFFHFFPKGAEDLVYFADWPSRFDIPELEAFCDIYAASYPRVARKT